jgi:hypothetical protein
MKSCVKHGHARLMLVAALLIFSQLPYQTATEYHQGDHRSRSYRSQSVIIDVQ